MSLDALVIEDFRCVARAELELDSRCNLISGANASGKTSLLEAMFVLGRGRSFRTARTEILIRNGTEAFTLAGKVVGRRSHSAAWHAGWTRRDRGQSLGTSSQRFG